MIGRYGVDDLSRAQIIVSMVLLLVSTFLSAFFRVNILYWLGLALLIYSYFRILSRNVSKRYEENQRYLNAKYRAVVKKNNLKKPQHYKYYSRKKHEVFPYFKSKAYGIFNFGRIQIYIPFLSM